jgi:DNA-binding CsgD family transcriptional regulator
MDWQGVAGYAAAISESLDVQRLASAHLRTVRKLIGADAYGIYSLDPQSYAPTALAVTGVSDSFVETYESLGRRQDPCFRHMLSTGRAVDDRMVFRRPMTSDPSSYAGMLRRHRLHFTMQAPLVAGGAVLGTINFARSSRHGPFRAGELRAATALARHASIALAHTLEHEGLRERCAAAEHVVANSREPVAVLRDDGEVVVQSAAFARARSGGTGELATETVPGTPLEVARVAAPRPGTAVADGLLTGREAEILTLACEGLTDAQIAARLCITVHTVKQHLKRSYAKLGAHSRTHAAWLMRG